MSHFSNRVVSVGLVVAVAGFLACVGDYASGLGTNPAPDAATSTPLDGSGDPVLAPGTITLEPSQIDLAPGQSTLVRVRSGGGVASIVLSIAVDPLPADAGSAAGAVSVSAPTLPIAGAEATFEVRASPDAGQQHFRLTATGGATPVVVPGRVEGRPGALDIFFGDHAGYFDFEVPGGSQNYAQAVVGLADGSFVVAGSVYGGGKAALIVARFTANGALDTTFGDPGAGARLGYTKIPDARDPRQIVPLLDGGFAVAARAPNEARLYRVNAKGEPDPHFGGVAGLDPMKDGVLESVAPIIAVSGDAVFLGGSVDGGIGILKYLPDGGRDPSFGTSGFALGGPVEPGRHVAMLSAADGGAIHAVGDFYGGGSGSPYRGWVARISSTGEWGGIRESPIQNGVTAVTSQGDKAVVGTNGYSGIGETNVYLSRYSPDLDKSFGTAGLSDLGPPGGNVGTVAGIVVEPSGNVLVATTVNGPDEGTFRVYRVTSSGTVDATFGNAGVTRIPGNGQALGVALTGPRQAVVVGLSDQATSKAARIARIWL